MWIVFDGNTNTAFYKESNHLLLSAQILRVLHYMAKETCGVWGCERHLSVLVCYNLIISGEELMKNHATEILSYGLHEHHRSITDVHDWPFLDVSTMASDAVCDECSKKI